MKLTELEAQFTKFARRDPRADEIAVIAPDTQPRKIETFQDVDTLAAADGIWFLCPLCFKANSGPIGTHMVRVGFRGIAEPGTYGYNKAGQPVLWQIVGGSTLYDLQLAPSIQLEGGCNWHGFVGSSGVPPGEAQ